MDEDRERNIWGMRPTFAAEPAAHDLEVRYFTPEMAGAKATQLRLVIARFTDLVAEVWLPRHELFFIFYSVRTNPTDDA